MPVASPQLNSNQLPSPPDHKNRRQNKLDKALAKHQRQLEKITLDEPAKSKHSEGKEPLTLSQHIPLDSYIPKHERKPKQKTNPFANVDCLTATGNLKKIGLELKPAHGSHHAIHTLPEPGHNLGLISIHSSGYTIPTGTHKALVGKLNQELIRLINQADEIISTLPAKTQHQFRSFVAENLAEAGATDPTDILPDDLLSTQDQDKIRALQALIKKANPDTVFNFWRREPSASSS